MTEHSGDSYAELERKLTACTAQLDEERAYAEAICEILRVISSSPTDAQPVFDVIADRAMTLCDARIANTTRFDGKLLHLMSMGGSFNIDEARAAYPMTLDTRGVNARAVLAGAPVQIADVLTDPDYSRDLKDIVLGAGGRSFLAVPLLRDGEVVGSIGVGRAEPGLFSEKLVKLLQTFADQAVIAIENVRLFNETQETLARQTATAEILRVISRSPTEVQPVFQAIAERAVAMCNALGSVTTRFDGDMVHAMAWAGSADVVDGIIDGIVAAFPMKLGRAGLSARAIVERAPVQIPEIDADPEYDPSLKDALGNAGARSGLAVPMLRGGEVLGTITMLRAEAGLFPDKLVSLLQTFADQAVIAIENVRLFNETQEALEQQTASSEVLRVISESPTDVQPVFDAIAERAMTLCNAKIGIASRFDGEWIHLAALYGLSKEAINGIRAAFPVQPGRSSISGRVVLERRPVQIADMPADPEYTVQAAVLEAGSALGVPLMREGRVVGVLAVARKETGVFPDKLVTLLQTFADQAVIAIENVRLFAETKEALEQQTAVSEILRVITESPSDVKPVLEAIADHAVDLCDSSSAAIYLTEGDNLRHVTTRGELAHQAAPIELIPIDRTSTSGRAIVDRKTVHVADMQAEADEYPRGHEIAQRLGHRTIVVAPLLREGRPFGTILLRRQERRPFTARELALLRTFGDQAAIALENVRLFNETKEALEQQTATAEVLSVISSSVAHTEPVFEKIIDSCERLFSGQQLAILLAGDDGLAHIGAIRGALLEEARTSNLFPLSIEQTAMELALKECALVHYPDFSAVIDKPPVLRTMYERIGNFSFVVAPMLWEGRAVGTISISRYPPKPFSDKEIALLKTFADQAVIAIENARLFHEIEDKSRELEVANQHKSEFLANMSHELRTPLNAIIGFSEVLIERMFGELNDKQADYLEDIHSSGKHLLALINDILDLSKIEAGRMELELEAFDVETVLANTLTLIRERAQQHGIELSLDTHGSLGEFRADQRKFKQIMLNLLSNAVKFTRDGGRIDVRAALMDEVLEVAVSDTGIGIAPKDQDTIFQEFQQVGGHYTNKQEGTGLGLALTKRFVDLHGGSLHLDSELGRGSTFTFTLPRQP